MAEQLWQVQVPSQGSVFQTGRTAIHCQSRSLTSEWPPGVVCWRLHQRNPWMDLKAPSSVGSPSRS